MENQKEQSVFKMDAEKAKLIASKNLYYSDHKKESEFSALPGNLQRAINREAEFHVKTLSQTEGYADILNAEDGKEAQKLHNALCEYFAHVGNMEEKKNPHNPGNKFAALLRADSEATHRQNIDAITSEEVSIPHATTRRAKHYNENIAAHKKKGGKRDAAENLQNLYNHLNSKGR